MCKLQDVVVAVYTCSTCIYSMDFSLKFINASLVQKAIGDRAELANV